MKKKMFIVISLLLVVPALLLFASCGRQSVKPEVGKVKDAVSDQ